MSQTVASSRRLIVKIGSSLLVDESTGEIKRPWLDALLEGPRADSIGFPATISKLNPSPIRKNPNSTSAYLPDRSPGTSRSVPPEKSIVAAVMQFL